LNKLISHIIWIRASVLWIVTLLTIPFLAAQVKGKIVSMDTPNTYKISIVPEQTWAHPNSITNSASFTLKVPTGGFQVEQLQSFTGTWELAYRIDSPPEASAYDYLVFWLATPLLDFTYETGIEVPLFSFLNTGECTGDVQILDTEVDPFLPPNSSNANIGNQFTILGHGEGNAYKGNIASSVPVNCMGLQYQIDTSSITCIGDSARLRLIFLDGVAPLRYALKVGRFRSLIGTIDAIGDTVYMSELLPSGDYSLLLTDAGQDTVWTKFSFAEPPELAIHVLYKEDINCNDTDGALVHVIPKGVHSDQTYQLNWSTGHTGEQVEGLRGGDYQVTLTNARGCSVKEMIHINEIPPVDIKVLEKVHPSCPGAEDGALTIDVTGGVGIQYFYEWEKEDLPKQWDLTNLEGGNYSVTVYDVSGCVSKTQIQLDIPPPIAPTMQFAAPTCPEFEDGQIVIAANKDGALPFQYSINSGTYKGQTEYLDLPAGEYQIDIVDNNDCTHQEKIVLIEPEQFDVDLGDDMEILIGESRYLVKGDVLDDKYQFDWSPKASLSCADCPNPVAKPLETTTYAVLVTNESGCYRKDEVTININLDRPVFFPTAFSPNGDGNNDYFEIPHGITTKEVVRLKMFNRWGQLLYDSHYASNDGEVKWDGNFEGKMVDSGLYIFAADILFDDGRIIPYHGDVLLVR